MADAKLVAGAYIVDGWEDVLRLQAAAKRARLDAARPERIPSGERVRAGDVWGRTVRAEDADSQVYLTDGWRVVVA